MTVEAKTSRTLFFTFAKKQPVVTKQMIKRVTVILLKTIGKPLFRQPIAAFSAFMPQACMFRNLSIL
jgi:hypothetical protein